MNTRIGDAIRNLELSIIWCGLFSIGCFEAFTCWNNSYCSTLTGFTQLKQKLIAGSFVDLSSLSPLFDEIPNR